MQVDAHQHFWRLARGDYGWLTPALDAIHRDFRPEDLAPVLARHAVARTILVQAAPSVAETEYLLELATAAPFVAGVVGWVDFDSPSCTRTVERLARDPLLVGLRPMVQDIADDDWLARPAHSAVFEAMVAHGLAFDALVLPRHLPRLAVVLDRHPDLAIVVDHAAKPPIRERRLDLWRADLAAVAARPNAWCKLSGLATEASTDWTVDDLRPVVDHLLDAFGAQRLAWGSDWPVVNLAGGYDRWRAATAELLAPLAADARDGILGGNAARIYLRGRGRR